MGAKAGGKRIQNGMLSIIKVDCPWCGHHKAWSKYSGVFCTKCGKNINILPPEPKPMRKKGTHPKHNRKMKVKKLKTSGTIPPTNLKK